MGDREERNENHENHEERTRERQRVPQRRVINIPLNLQGEQHQFPTLPQGVLPTFPEDGSMDQRNIWINF
jgi:hypothetical protein